jgi:outer membrane protein OmpA-like peptidoglycan-associated protein
MFARNLCFSALLASTALVGLTATAADSAANDQWYFSPGLGVMLFQHGQPSRDGADLSLRAGYDLPQRPISIELGGSIAEAKEKASPNEASGGRQIYGIWADSLFHLQQWEAFDPFVSAGLGYFCSDHHGLPEHDDHAFMPRLGVGFKYTLSEGVAARADWTLMSTRFDGSDVFSTLEAGLDCRLDNTAAAMPPPLPPPVAETAPTPSVQDLSDQVDKYHAGDLAAGADLSKLSIEMEFGHDVSVIDEKYYDELDSIAQVLKDHPGSIALIEGHADRTKKSDKAYNQRLSELRANAAVHYLVKSGIAASRLMSKGYGFSRPKDAGAVDLVHGNPEDRRVDIFIKNSGGKGGEEEYDQHLKTKKAKKTTKK